MKDNFSPSAMRVRLAQLIHLSTRRSEGVSAPRPVDADSPFSLSRFRTSLGTNTSQHALHKYILLALTGSLLFCLLLYVLLLLLSPISPIKTSSPSDKPLSDADLRAQKLREIAEEERNSLLRRQELRAKIREEYKLLLEEASLYSKELNTFQANYANWVASESIKRIASREAELKKKSEAAADKQLKQREESANQALCFNIRKQRFAAQQAYESRRDESDLINEIYWNVQLTNNDCEPG